MIDNIVTSINAGLTKVVGEVIDKSLYAGNETPEAREVRVQKALEDARKKVPPVYDSKGKFIEYDNYGRHLSNVKA